jgi:phosphoribosylanthranilate isomerase
MRRTRIKICGITREADLASAARYGADAVGLVFYRRSPRAVALERAAELAASAPPFVSVVALFVNPDPAEVHSVLERIHPDLLQFHGDESPEFCESFAVPYVKAARVRPGLDLLQYAKKYQSARALLLDAHVEGYGGGGSTFDWHLVPPQLPLPVILSGGLTPENVVEAVRRVRPWAVDVSSGVESSKGLKDDAKIAAFCEGVRIADV